MIRTYVWGGLEISGMSSYIYTVWDVYICAGIYEDDLGYLEIYVVFADVRGCMWISGISGMSGMSWMSAMYDTVLECLRMHVYICVCLGMSGDI